MRPVLHFVVPYAALCRAHQILQKILFRVQNLMPDKIQHGNILRLCFCPVDFFQFRAQRLHNYNHIRVKLRAAGM